VITVGAVDDVETAKVGDDRLPAFSSWGPTAEKLSKPDAPGARLISLSAPGSYINDAFAGLDGTYRRGSGTSMSAAVVSGLTAQLLQARPKWRPDDVKAALAAGAVAVASNERDAVGAGLVNGPAALKARINPTYRTVPLSTGGGSLLLSRGTTCLSDLLCAQRLVDVTAQGDGRNWQALDYAGTQWNATTWYSSQWVGTVEGRNWQTSTWVEGRNWQGRNWQGSSWYGNTDNTSYGTPIPGSGSYGVWGG
jgi:hypothetical protein